MVKVVGFPAPVDVAGLKPGSAFQMGDFDPPLYALTLKAGDRLTAIEYSLHAGDRYHFWFPAYQPALARCSPGILLTMDTMQQGCAQGYRVFDFGFGGEGYKKYFCNATQSVREAVVLRPGVGAMLSDAAVGLLNTAGGGRGERLRTSVRRRWAAIEACETTPANRFRSALSPCALQSSKPVIARRTSLGKEDRTVARKVA